MLVRASVWNVVLKLLIVSVPTVTLKTHNFLGKCNNQKDNMVSRKKTITKSSESKKRHDASKKGWITRRLNTLKKKPSSKKTSRNLSSEKLKKLQREEKIRNTSRRNAQKKGRSLATDKPKLKSRKPVRLARRASKKRVSVR